MIFYRFRSVDASSESDNQAKSIQRASSLKEDRLKSTPKRKRSERRKTCTPILSSSSCSSESSPSPTEEPNFLEKFSQSTTISDDIPRQGDEKMEVESSMHADVAVYKVGGDEISVEKGIVKKQKMGKHSLKNRINF